MGQSIKEPQAKPNSSMKMFVVLALAAVAFAEPEADPALLYNSPVYSRLGLYRSPVVSNVYTAPVAPAVYKTPVVYKSPVVSTHVAAPVVSAPVSTYSVAAPVVRAPVVSTYSVAAPVSTYSVAAPTQVVTNYNSPAHYTAQATPLGKALGLPQYVAKNGNLEHVVHKREAEAEAEPEADPLLYTAGVHAPVTYTGLNNVVSPVVPYTGLNAAVAPAVTYTGLNKVVSPVTYTGLNTAVYPYAGVYGAPHAVVPAATATGYTHSSNVGLCFNNYGVQVSC